MARCILLLALTDLLGCAAPRIAPAEQRAHAPARIADSALLEDDAVERARQELPEPFTGVLYPPTAERPDGAYGLLHSEPAVTRPFEGGWLVTFAFRCPDDPTRGRVVRVRDDGSTRLLYPPVRLPSLEAAALDDHALLEEGVRGVSGAARPEAIGEWRAPSGVLPPGLTPRDDVYYAGPAPFVYDGRTVRISLWAMRPWEWRPEDSVYRLDASWDGDVLRIRYPAGTVEELARFRDGRFEDLPRDGVPAWPMERAATRIAPPHEGVDSAILRPRPIHDYTLPMNSGPIVVRCRGDDCDSNLGSPRERLCR